MSFSAFTNHILATTTKFRGYQIMLDSAIIESIKWPAVVLMITILFLMRFGKQIAALISKVDRVKAGRFEATADSKEGNENKAERQVEPVPENREISQPVTLTTTEVIQPIAVDDVELPKSLDEWRKELAFAALIFHDQKRFDRAYQEILNISNGDRVSRKRDEIDYHKWSYYLGRKNAVLQIEKFLEDNDVAYEAHLALGLWFSWSGNFGRSSNFYMLALQRARTEEEKTVAVTGYSYALYRDDNKTQSLEVLMNALSNTTDEYSTVKIYSEIAEYYERENDFENRAIALEKVVDSQPNDTVRLFHIAYAYAQRSYNDIALVHYKNARLINPDDSGVQNNLGVQYDRLGMPIKSISHFREAERLGHTLACANIAKSFISVGFVKEAKELLDFASNKEKPDPSVHLTLADISKKSEAEDELEKNQEKSGQELRKYFSKYASAKFHTDVALKDASGSWKTEYGTLYQLEIRDSLLIATWKSKLYTLENEYKMDGVILNNSATLLLYQREYNFSSKEYEFKKKGRGFLYYTRTNDTLNMLEDK